jgi:electron transport complex protein RnfB
LRLQREKQENDARLAGKALAKLAEVDASNAQTDAERAEKERKRAIIQAAIERSRQQKEAAPAAPPEKKL